MSSTGRQAAIYRQVAATIDAGRTDFDVKKIDVWGDVVTIHLSNRRNAPAAERFAVDLIDEVGPKVKVVIE